MESVAGKHIECKHNTGQCGAKSAEAVDHQFRAGYRQPHQQRGCLTPPDGVRVSSEFRVMGQINAKGNHDQSDDDANGYEVIARQLDLRLGRRRVKGIIDRNRVDADDVAQAAGQEHPRQRHDKRLNVEIMNRRPHRRSESRPHDQNE
ncbi:hypothetical protein D3C81_1837600 [compost metagenome]